MKNGGKQTIRLVRPRSGELERFANFFGWKIGINGPGGKFDFIPIPKPRPPLRGDDLIELRPGESFGFEVDLTRVPLLKGVAPYKTLSETEGRYRVRLIYRSSKDYFGPQLKTSIKDVFLGPVSSDILEFEINRKE